MGTIMAIMASTDEFDRWILIYYEYNLADISREALPYLIPVPEPRSLAFTKISPGSASVILMDRGAGMFWG